MNDIIEYPKFNALRGRLIFQHQIRIADWISSRLNDNRPKMVTYRRNDIDKASMDNMISGIAEMYFEFAEIMSSLI